MEDVEKNESVTDEQTAVRRESLSVHLKKKPGLEMTDVFFFLRVLLFEHGI